MDLHRSFEVTTRTISGVSKKMSGQVFESNATTIHFDILKNGQDWDFISEGYTPYIIFRVYDENGDPMVFGPNSSPCFGGYSFNISYQLTSRLQSSRLEYQLFFLKANIDFTGRFDGLSASEYILSSIDGIVLKPSIMGCGPRPGHCDPCGDRPFAPSSCEPSVLSWLRYWQDRGMMLDMDICTKMHNGLPGYGYILTFHSYSGQTRTIDLNVPTLDEDGKVSVDMLPVGNKAGDLVRLLEPVGKGQTIIYDSINNGGFVSTGFRGATLPTALRYTPIEESSEGIESRHLVQLIGSDGTVMSTIDLPIENVVESADYDPVTKELIIRFGSGQETRINMKDLVDLYTPVEGELVIISGTGAQGEPTPYLIGLSDVFKNRIRAIEAAAGSHYNDTDNPHGVTKAQVGLSNVNNTSDMDKPVSTAQQAAIDSVEGILNTTIDVVRNAVIGLDNTINGADGIIARHARDVQELRDSDISLQSLIGKKADMTYVDAIVDQKQDKLIGGVNIQIDDQNRINYVGPTTYVDNALSSESTNPVQNKVINKALSEKQDVLIAGENIAITGNTITATLPKITIDSTISHTSTNPVENRIIARELDRKANIGEGVSVWKGQTSGGQYLYNSGDVVVYDGNLYISKVDNNDHHPDDETCWNVVRSGAMSSIVGLTAATYIGVFGNDAAIDYTIPHNLGSRNLIYSIMTNDSEHEFILARVSAPTLNTLRVRLTSPPGTNGLVINVMKARTATTVPITEFPVAIKVSEPSMEWSFVNDSGMPLYAKAYDAEGNDLPGDIIQNSVTAFSPITVGFSDTEHAGTLFLQSTPSELVKEMDGTHLEIPTEAGKRYLVQCYRDGEGQSILDVVQNEGSITVDCSVKWKGIVCLYEATSTYAFTASDLTEIEVDDQILYKFQKAHNKGRVVGAQVYGDEGLMMVDIHCPTNNEIEIYFNQPVSGELLII